VGVTTIFIPSNKLPSEAGSDAKGLVQWPRGKVSASIGWSTFHFPYHSAADSRITFLNTVAIPLSFEPGSQISHTKTTNKTECGQSTATGKKNGTVPLYILQTIHPKFNKNSLWVWKKTFLTIQMEWPDRHIKRYFYVQKTTHKRITFYNLYEFR
jgi:hypothetical protein